MLLLHKLGFHLANDVGKCFPRIPHFWSADHLFQLASKLGPVQKQDLNVDPTLMDMALLEIKQENNMEENETLTILPKKEVILSSDTNDYLDPVIPMDQTSSNQNNQEDLDPFIMPTPTTSWIQLALTSKKKAQMSAASPQQQKNQKFLIKGDLTSTSMENMQISDEDESKSMSSIN